MHEILTARWNSVSLRTKITGVTVLLVTLGLLVAGVGTSTVLRNYLLERGRQQHHVRRRRRCRCRALLEPALRAVPDRTTAIYIAVVNDAGRGHLPERAGIAHR